jgi:hypothetical protein
MRSSRGWLHQRLPLAGHLLLQRQGQPPGHLLPLQELQLAPLPQRSLLQELPLRLLQGLRSDSPLSSFICVWLQIFLKKMMLCLVWVMCGEQCFMLSS